MKTTPRDVLEIAFDEGGPDNGRPVLLQGACDYCDLPIESEGLEKHREAPAAVADAILRHLRDRDRGWGG
jgi:hypothetical protein